jgi:hypothetical protein
MAAKRKALRESISPAMQFISRPEEEPEAEAIPITGKPETPPEGYKVNPLYIETRSKRLQLLLQPSLHARIKERAGREGVSVNELIHTLLEAAMEEE